MVARMTSQPFPSCGHAGHTHSHGCKHTLSHTLIGSLWHSVWVPTLSYPLKMPIVKAPNLSLFVFFLCLCFSFSLLLSALSFSCSLPPAFYHLCLYPLNFSLPLPRLISFLTISSRPLLSSPIYCIHYGLLICMRACARARTHTHVRAHTFESQ